MHVMQLGDARKLSQDTQEALRKRAIKLVTVDRRHVRETAFVLGVARGTVHKWLKSYRAHGESGIVKKRRGRRPEEQRILSKTQCKIIQRFITDKCPDQLKMPFALWTRKSVGHLIKYCFGIKLAPSTVGAYLRSWGYTAQKPLRRSYERQPKRIEKWLKEEYPAIAARAKAEKAEIQWGDEAGVCSTCQVIKTYAPKGKTPVLRQPGKRFSMSMISTVTNRGALKFMVYEVGLNIAIFLRFLKRLIKYQKKKIFLILDNLKVHHAKKVQTWIKNHQKSIELFFLPAYAPEYNPDEYLNNTVKQRTHHKKMSRNQEELTKHLRSTLARLQKEPETIRKLFQAPSVRYAA
jgi:transposase